MCYNSFEKATETSAVPFIEDKVKAGHWSVLEHAGIDVTDNMPHLDKLKECSPEFGLVMSRAALGGIRYSDLIKYSSEFDTFEKAIKADSLKRDIYVMSFEITSSRYISQQFERHRNLSYAERSLRFCKVTKDNFGVVLPKTIKTEEDIKPLTEHISKSIDIYNQMIEQGYKKDDARAVLPLCTETKFIASGQITWWLDFLTKRYTPVASYEMIRLCKDLFGQMPVVIKETFDKDYKQQREKADECIKDK
jgi:thymidylate synthase ThyX